MVEEELAANKQLTAWDARDLNKEPSLPYPDNTFDTVTNCVRWGPPRVRAACA